MRIANAICGKPLSVGRHLCHDPSAKKAKQIKSRVFYPNAWLGNVLYQSIVSLCINCSNACYYDTAARRNRNVGMSVSMTRISACATSEEASKVDRLPSAKVRHLKAAH
jgi:hypothetical protein